MAGARVTLTCTSAACGKTFTRLASQVANGDPFCSRACLYAHRAVAIPARTCENPACGQAFTPARANKDRARFCSRDCMLAAARVDVECPGCGRTHQVRQADTRAERSRLYYCPDCQEAAPDQRGRPPVKRIEVTCANPACGATLLRYPNSVSPTGRMFCDARCRAAGGPRVSTKPSRTCQYAPCGRTFIPGKNATGKFCSRECWNLHKRSAGRVERACTGCGVVFTARKSDPDVYHSWDCYQAHRGTPVGARKRHQDGYVLIYAPGHPEAQATGWAFEHRVLISDLLGRALLPDEEVHHVHGVRDDNTTDGPLRLRDGKLRTGDLELWVKSQPAGQRVADQIEWARTLLTRYDSLVR